MRKITVVCLFAMVAALFSVPTYADTVTSYTITFMTSVGSPAPVSGSFTYDSTTPKFSNFFVTWNGTLFNLTSEANSPTTAGSGCTGESSTPAYGFGIMSASLSCGGLTSYVWSGFAGQGMGGAGIFDFIAGTVVGDDLISAGGVGVGNPTAVGHYTISAVPEPPTSLLMAVACFFFLALTRLRCN